MENNEFTSEGIRIIELSNFSQRFWIVFDGCLQERRIHPPNISYSLRLPYSYLSPITSFFQVGVTTERMESVSHSLPSSPSKGKGKTAVGRRGRGKGQ